MQYHRKNNTLTAYTITFVYYSKCTFLPILYDAAFWPSFIHTYLHNNDIMCVRACVRACLSVFFVCLCARACVTFEYVTQIIGFTVALTKTKYIYHFWFGFDRNI